MSGIVLIIELMTGQVLVPMPDMATCYQAATQAEPEFSATADCGEVVSHAETKPAFLNIRRQDIFLEDQAQPNRQPMRDDTCIPQIVLRWRNDNDGLNYTCFPFKLQW